MTDDTWVLVAIYIDEEHLTWREIADRLNRDPEDFAARMREGIRAGKLDETRRHLEAWGGLYARRTQRVHREAVM